MTVPYLNYRGAVIIQVMLCLGMVKHFISCLCAAADSVILMSDWHVELSWLGAYMSVWGRAWTLHCVHESQSVQSLASWHSGLKVSRDVAVVIYKWWVLFLRDHGSSTFALMKRKSSLLTYEQEKYILQV